MRRTEVPISSDVNNGVMTMAASVLAVVIATERATSAFARALTRLLATPPADYLHT